MRKEQEAADAEAAAYRDNIPAGIAAQQNIARGIFAALVVALGYGVSVAVGTGTFDQGIERPPSEPFELPFKLPSLPSPPKVEIRTGYEDRTDIGQVRPLFKPDTPAE